MNKRSNFFRSLACVVVLSTMTLFGFSRENQVFSPSDPSVTYVGRTFIQDKKVSFDWAGVYFRFRFTGTSLSLKISDTKSNYYDVFLNDSWHSKVNFRGQDTIIHLFCNLDPGVHSVSIHKCTEGNEGKTTLHEILLDEGASLLPSINKERYKIEFIGNSITCGFGTETNNPQEKYTPETENSYHSYAAITSRYFDADYVLTAHSGIGVVHNYGDKKGLSEYTMLHRFFNTLDNTKDENWDFSKWKPDVVVINLGTNDFSQEIKPTKADFIKGYKKLLSSVRKVYGNIPIFCLTSPMSNSLQFESVKEACESYADAQVYFIPMLSHTLKGKNDLGAAYHPSYTGQRKMAMLLIPYISSVMNWDLTNRSIK